MVPDLLCDRVNREEKGYIGRGARGTLVKLY